MSKYQLTAIIELLNPDNTISAHRMLAHSIGMTEKPIVRLALKHRKQVTNESFYQRILP